MNKNKKALLLSSITALSILCGCGTETKTIQIEGETYVQSGEEYVKVEVSDRTFEPGTHVIHYVDIVRNGESINSGNIVQGYDNAYFNFPADVPEGYKVIGATSYSNNSGYDSYIVYILVNEKTVVAKGRYDSNTNEVVYETPGEVIEQELTLN